MKSQPIYQLYVGSETGILKKIDIEKKSWQNINSVTAVDKEQEIVALCWNNDEQTEICRALRNQTLVISGESESRVVDLKGGQGIFKGLDRINEKYITCTESGSLRLWDSEGVLQVEKAVGADICCMRSSHADRNLVVTGGKENELKLWNLSQLDKPSFAAKNPSHDWLNLRKPVWVLDAGFMPNSSNIVTSTSYHQIRLYDPRSQRRPVIDIEFMDSPITTLSCHHNGSNVLIGNSHGNMAMVDLRGKGHIVQKYKGPLGGVRQVLCHPSADLMASCGLDRCVRIHDINSRQLLNKFYLKSRLNCILFQDKFDHTSSQDLMNSSGIEAAEDLAESGKTRRTGKRHLVESEEDDDKLDNLWSDMKEIQTKKLKRKSKAESVRDIKNAQLESKLLTDGQKTMIKSSNKKKKSKKAK